MQEIFHRPERVYLLPVGGTAMAGLAGLLAALGHHVEGVDSQLYPPMSTLLEELGIPVRIGYDPAGVPPTDRVVIGNAVPASNPEVVAVRERGIPFLSQAEAVSHYLLATGRRGLVVAGTHGKTTTSSLLAWTMEAAGCDPSYLVGGLMRWSRRSFRLGAGPWMVLEGDEYNTAYFDRGPKFLHYRPELFVLGPVEFDHADIYRDLDAVLTAFRAGTAQVPSSGSVVVGTWCATALSAVRDTAAEVVTVGSERSCDLRLVAWEPTSSGATALLRWRGRELTLSAPLFGEHNLQNAAMALAAAITAGVDPEAGAAALARFPGVARRLEVVGEAAGVTVVDDFAHHPTALAATVAAARLRWPGRRLVVAFEPRSLTAARREFEDAYTIALAGADVALVTAPFHRGRLAADSVLDPGRLGLRLAQAGVIPLTPADDDDPAAMLVETVRHGDVVVVCSSGDFGGLHRRLVGLLGGRESNG